MKINTHQKKAVQFLAIAFGLIVLLISAVTSFGFFHTFFDGLIPAVDTSVSSLISGLVGVLVADVATAVWLILYLQHAETAEQRAISLIMTVVTFLQSAAASISYLVLTANGNLTEASQTADTVSTFALVFVVVAVVANFGAVLAYQRFSQENKTAVREAERRDRLQQTEDEQAAYLDELVSQKVQELLVTQAETLATDQAKRIYQRFYQAEIIKYADTQTADFLNPNGEN